MKYESKCKIFLTISLIVITLYFLLNTAFILEWLNVQGTLSAFANVVFTLDCFTWYIYGMLAVISFGVRIYSLRNENSTVSKTKTVLHFVLILISFFEIYHIIQNAF